MRKIIRKPLTLPLELSSEYAWSDLILRVEHCQCAEVGRDQQCDDPRAWREQRLDGEVEVETPPCVDHGDEEEGCGDACDSVHEQLSS